MMTVLDFAKSELNKYLFKITGSDACGILVEAADGDTDGYEIAVEGGRGIIHGFNERSALLGVYAFLHRIGCRFLAPGEKNEYIVRLPSEQLSCELTFRYTISHRGLVTEGDIGENTVEGVVDWSVKNGMNSYFIQFGQGREFFERQLNHGWDPFREKEEYDGEKLATLYKNAVAAVKKRGMKLHAVGHGWTCAALGVDGEGWYETEDDVLPEDKRQWLALIDGERKFFGKIPINTNLCYSDKRAFGAFVDGVIDYARSHPETDFLHIWLADNRNNFCECDECRKKLPAEQYIELLNEIDAKLTEIGSEMKLVFLIYYELLIPPAEIKLNNPERFVMMFAPISRSYDFGLESYFGPAEKADLPLFVRNRFKLPDTALSLAYLKKWQEGFKGDSFIFDYPLMWECFAELTGIRIAKTISEDVNGLKELGLNGYLSCQVQKTFFPTGLASYTLAKKLEDASLTFEEIRDEYFSTAFGEFAERVYAVLEEFSSTPVIRALKKEVSYETDEVIADALRLKDKAAEYAEEIEAMQGRVTDGFILRNLEKVRLFFETYRIIMRLLLKRAEKTPDKEVLSGIFKELSEFIYSHEQEFAEEWDCMYYCCNLHLLTETDQ